MTKTRRLELLAVAIDGAQQALDRLDRMTHSNNLNISTKATALLIVERNEVEDLKSTRSLIGNKPANQLKAISEAEVAMLEALEKSIDERIQTNRIVNAGLGIVSETLRSAEAIGQMVAEV